MGDNGKGGNGGRRPKDPAVPWEGIRALVWEQRRCRELCFEPRAAGYIRVIDGERLTTGYTEARLMVAIDLARMVERLGKEIGHHRRERFEDWVAGFPVGRLGAVEQVQLKDDVRRLEELAINGGYRQYLLAHHFHCSGSP